MVLRVSRSAVARAAALSLLACGVVAASRMDARPRLEAGALPITHPRTAAVGQGDGVAPQGAVHTVEAAASAPKPPGAEARTWSELRADATRLLGRRVRFVVQFHGRVERWNTYLSRFGTHDYAAFQFWTDEQFPWRVEDFEAPVVRLFARRGSDAEAELARGARYARFEIEGTLRELFLGEPWVDVESARVLPERLTEGTVIHGGRALSLMTSGLWRLAESEFDIALQASLPVRAREELERVRQECREQVTAQSSRPGRREGRPWTGPLPKIRPRKRVDPDD